MPSGHPEEGQDYARMMGHGSPSWHIPVSDLSILVSFGPPMTQPSAILITRMTSIRRLSMMMTRPIQHDNYSKQNPALLKMAITPARVTSPDAKSLHKSLINI